MSSYSYGDHYVHIKIRVPKKLTRRQRSLLLSYAEEETDVPGTVNGVEPSTGGSSSSGERRHTQTEEEEGGGFLSKLKNMFS
ncbi:hypothetical protein CesoFtcFv8_008226 [Champsocephalus esox]|nr:hypothetical protein CesoFtcFv8_008226 [Champsocephalus esox]